MRYEVPDYVVIFFYPVTTFILGPDIAHNTLLSKTLHLFTSLMLTAGNTVILYILRLGNGKIVQKLMVVRAFLNKLLKTCFTQHL